MRNKEELVELITRRVLAELDRTKDDECPDCEGSCVANCPDKVRAVMGQGAGRISYRGNGGNVPADMASYIDHTLLAPGATGADIDRLCEEADRYGFAAVCVNPGWVARARQNLRGSKVKVCSVIGFPLGANSTDIKVLEARRAIREGAREIDMVINVGRLKEGDYDFVEQDIARVVDACREVGALCKVIIEAAMLTDEEKVVACQLAGNAKADFVKTSTGFGPGGATAYDVALMRETVGPLMGVKASGGIKTTDDAEQMIAAGATRIGASAGISIVSKNGGGGK
jgi:deoxyribose-phosphate aldolase